MAVGDIYTDPNNSCILKPFKLGGLKMSKFIDRTGMCYGRLTVIKHIGTTVNKKPLWKCLCDCGNITNVDSCSLATGNTVSCGCYLKERITKHGGWKKSSYNTWRAMLRRCNNPQDKDYPRYGAVGIKVCNEWLDYLTFVSDMSEPEGTQTLDRINPYGNYEPTNCEWRSPTKQARNIRKPKTSKTGIIGVLFHNKKYYAAITVQKKKFYSKACATVEEAAQARKELEKKHWI